MYVCVGQKKLVTLIHMTGQQFKMSVESLFDHKM